MKPLSIQLYTVRELTNKIDPVAVLKRIAEIGYKGVEGFGYGYTPEQFRRIVEDLGMSVSSYFGPIPTPQTVNQFVDTAKALGVKHTVTGFWIPDYESVDAIRATAEKVNEVLPTIQAAGLTFSLHNHWFEFQQIAGKLPIEYLIEQAPSIGLELDIYWAGAFGENKPEEMVAKFKDRIYVMHVKDGSQIQGDPHLAVGSGTVDIPACIHAADPTKLDWLIVELDEHAGEMIDAVAQSYKYLIGNGLAEGTKPV